MRCSRQLERREQPTVGIWSGSFVTWQGLSVIARATDRMTARLLVEDDARTAFTETYSLAGGTLSYGTYVNDDGAFPEPPPPTSVCLWERAGVGLWVESEERSREWMLDFMDAAGVEVRNDCAVLGGLPADHFDEHGSALLLSLFGLGIAELSPGELAVGRKRGAPGRAGEVFREVGDGRDPRIVVRSETAELKLMNFELPEREAVAFAVDNLDAVDFER